MSLQFPGLQGLSLSGLSLSGPSVPGAPRVPTEQEQEEKTQPEDIFDLSEIIRRQMAAQTTLGKAGARGPVRGKIESESLTRVLETLTNRRRLLTASTTQRRTQRARGALAGQGV